MKESKALWNSVTFQILWRQTKNMDVNKLLFSVFTWKVYLSLLLLTVDWYSIESVRLMALRLLHSLKYTKKAMFERGTEGKDCVVEMFTGILLLLKLTHCALKFLPLLLNFFLAYSFSFIMHNEICLKSICFFGLHFS